MKGIIKLLPCTGRVNIGYVKYIPSGNIYKAIKKLKTGNYLVKEIVDTTTREDLIISERNLIPLKYYILGNRKVAELHYQDYDKVKDGDKVEVGITPIFNKVELGDTVSLFKFNARLCNYIFPLPGVISKIKGSTFTIDLKIGEEIDVRRHFFKLTGKVNKINIGWISKKD